MKECHVYQSRIKSCNVFIKRMNKKINNNMKKGLFEATVLCGTLSEETYEVIKQYYNERGFTVDRGFNRYGRMGIAVSW